MNSVNANLQGRRFTFFTNHSLDFFLSLLDHFFDSCRMDSAIYDQFFQCDTRHFSADWIKSGQDNCFRCIINDQIHTRKCLQCTDISSFSTNDSSLHLVIWKLYYRNRRLSHMICRTFLNCCDYILLRFLASLFFCLTFHFLDHFRGIKFHIFFNSF